MRILHISSVYPPLVVGGAEKVVEMLAEAQAAAGETVGVAYLSREAQPAGIRAGVTTMPQTSRNLLWMEDVFRAARPLRTANKLVQMFDVRAAADFARAIAAFRPDVVHTHSMVELPPMIWSRIAASGARAVHTLHDYDLVCSRASLFRNGHNCVQLHPSCRLSARWKRRFARQIDAVAAVSAPVLAEHRRRGLFTGLPPENARVIWNAAALRAQQLAPRVPRQGPMIFGFLGRLVPEKGILTLIEACRSLPPDGWELRVAGRAQQGDGEYRALAAGLPVSFLGFADAPAFLRAIDILVVPSVWREPFGLTVVEAFAQGVPVIGSDVGAIPELVRPVGNDWVVAAGDPAALAARMRQAIVEGRKALPGPERFAGVLAGVAPARMVADYRALYERVLVQPRAA